MTQRTDFIKIRVFIPIKEGDIMIRNNDGSFIGSPAFNELTYEADEKFREPIITFINDEIGLDTWAIKFIQFDQDATHFDARLFCTNETDALKMVSIIKERIKDKQFNWFYEGDITKYIGHQ